jgi:3-methylfumaryl-CoA hydratase
MAGDRRDVEARIDRWPAHALAATLDLGAAELDEELPPLWHWLYFLAAPRRSELGLDGHWADPDLVDPADPRRRMFASARIDFERPLRFDRIAHLTETKLRSRDTQGGGGPIRIVTLEYRVLQDGALCLREERDLVYLKAPPASRVAAGAASGGAASGGAEAGDAAQAAMGAAGATVGCLEITPDPVMLMRFSALTFNSHRIHYDQDYAQRQEGYPERVVHGPLIAILLAEQLRLQGIARLRRFEFRAKRPLFVDRRIRLTAQADGARISLCALDPSGTLAAEATVIL